MKTHKKLLKGKEDVLSKEILLFDKIAKILRKKRMATGALSIDSEEIKFKLDDQGFPEDVVIKKSKDANKLIEEFMLLANRSVAKLFGQPKRVRLQYLLSIVFTTNLTWQKSKCLKPSFKKIWSRHQGKSAGTNGTCNQ